MKTTVRALDCAPVKAMLLTLAFGLLVGIALNVTTLANDICTALDRIVVMPPLSF